MELMLNLAWLGISLVLGVFLFASRRPCGSASKRFIHRDATAWLALVVLAALLLPAISMTDDRQAMVTPNDGEQVVRRYEVAAHIHLIPPPSLWFPAVRKTDWMLACFGRVEIVPDCCPAPAPVLRRAVGRAPPAIA